MVETVLAVVGDVEIFPPVVVVISHAHSLPPSGRDQARPRGNVRKGSIMIIVIEVVGGCLIRREALQSCTVHNEDVGPSVVVIIENRDATSCCLENIFLGVDSAKNSWRGQASFFADVSKFNNRRWWLPR